MQSRQEYERLAEELKQSYEKKMKTVQCLSNYFITYISYFIYNMSQGA
jgi:hypothetical protein